MKHISNTQGHSHKDTRGQTHHTLTHMHVLIQTCSAVPHLEHTHRQQLPPATLSPPALIYTNCLQFSPPLYSLIHSRLCLPPTAPLKWFIKDPKHLSVGTFLCFYMDILVRRSVSLHLVSHPFLETLSSLGFVICHYLNFPFISLAAPSWWPLIGSPLTGLSPLHSLNTSWVISLDITQ